MKKYGKMIQLVWLVLIALLCHVIVITAETVDHPGIATLSTPVPINIGLGKTVYTSGDYSAQFPKQAINDGSMETVWGSLYNAGPQWFFIDLGSVQWVDYVNLCFFADFYASDFYVGISDTATQWEFTATVINGTGGCHKIEIKRYLRYIGVYLENAPKKVTGVKEFEVMTLPLITPTPTPLSEYDLVQDILGAVDIDVSVPPTDAPNVVLTTLNDIDVNLTDIDKGVIFLNLWTTWCRTCYAEAPKKDSLYAKIKDYNPAVFEMICASHQETKEDVEAYLARNNLSFPAYLDKNGMIFDLYDVKGFPTTNIIYKGKIVGSFRGDHDWGSEPVVDAFKQIITLAGGN